MENLRLFEVEMPRVVSYSQLALYLDCPRRYAHTYIARLPQYTGATLEMRVGTTVHSVLASFLAQGGSARSRGDLEAALLGRLTPLLSRPTELIDSICGCFSEEDLQARPRAVESPFKVKLGGVVVEGRFDRLDMPQHRHVVVTDYKVFEPVKSQAEADADFQMGIYALAAMQLFPDAELVDLDLMYLDHGITVRTRRSPVQLHECEQRIRATVAAIDSDSVFAPKESRYCGICSLRGDCHE